MKALLATAIAAFLSLFGIHQAPAHTVRTPPSAQVASAVSAVEDPFHPASNRPGATTSRNASSNSTSSPQTTVVKQYITQPVIERIIQSPPMTSGLVLGASTDDTAVTLADLQNQINALANLPRSVFVPSFSGPAQTTPVNTATFAQSQRIDNLSGTSLSNITVNGVSGLTDADIPDGLTASNYLPLSGGTLAGDLTLTGNLTVSGAQTLSGAITIPYLTAASSATASIFNGGFLSLASSTIGNGTQAGGLTISGGATTTGNAYFAGNVGIAQTSPTYKLDVSGLGHFTGLVDAANFVATSSSVASSIVYRLGINKASPSYPLDVAGNINVSAGSAYMYNGSAVITASTTLNSFFFGASSGNLTSTGNNNIGVGNASLLSNTSGYENVGIGTYSLLGNTSGYLNSAFGGATLLSNTTGNNNTAIGGSTLYANTTGYNNTGIGSVVLRFNTTGVNNIGIGFNALYTATSSNNNVAVGQSAGFNISGATGAVGGNNSLFGYQSGYDITTGSNNLILGYYPTTGQGVTTGSDNILIGRDVRAGLTQTGSNQLNIGNLIFGTSVGTGATLGTGNVGIGTTSPFAKLSISNARTTTANTPLFVIASTTDGTATTTVLSVASTGDVTIIGSATTCIIGNGGSATNCSVSDQRLKDNVTGLDVSNSLSAIKQLNPVSFLWNPFMVGNGAPTSTQFGFIAQDVSKIFPNLVAQDAHTGYFKLDYQGLFAPIVAAIQVLAQKVDELAATVATFADHFATKELTFTRATGDEIDVRRLCVRDTAGATCISRAQLDALLQQAGQSPAAGPTAPAPTSTTTGDQPADATVTEFATPVTEPTTPIADSPSLVPEEEPEPEAGAPTALDTADSTEPAPATQ